MDENNSPFYKNLSFWNLIFFIALTITGLFVTKCLQDRVEKLETENRAQTFRPKIELKNQPVVTNVVLKNDANWIEDNYKVDTISRVPFIISANFSFTLINTTDNIADIFISIFFDTTSSIPKTSKELIQLKAKENVNEEKIQLDYLDTCNFNSDNWKIQFLESNTFYLHFIVYYSNQSNDLYMSYFIVKGTVDTIPDLYLPKLKGVIDMKINEMYMKPSFITLDKPKKYTYLINKHSNIEMIKDRYDKAIDKLDDMKKKRDDILKKQ